MRTTIFLFVNTHHIPDYQYGGVVESGSKLFKYLKRLADFRLSCVSKKPEVVKKYLSDKEHCYKSIYFHRFAVSFDSILGLWRDVKKADVILINGIFTFPVTFAALYATILGKPFVVAPRGGLEPWRVAHKKWKKYFYIRFVTLPLMRKARYIHVTSVDEEKNIKALGFENTIKISNGIDLEAFEDLPEKYSFRKIYDGKFVFLFMSRTDKEKGIDLLLETYRRFCKQFKRDKHILLLVGPDNQNYLKKMFLDFEEENIEYIDGVYGKDKMKLIRRADVIVLPSYSENFGNIIAEALVCERPVITTTATPWHEIEKVGCGYFIYPDKVELFNAMRRMFQKDRGELEEMGKKGRKYVIENFNWESTATELYNHLQTLLY